MTYTRQVLKIRKVRVSLLKATPGGGHIHHAPEVFLVFFILYPCLAIFDEVLEHLHSNIPPYMYFRIVK